MSGTEELGADFWSWRARQQPRSHDDIPRIVRPDGWLPDWSAEAVAAYRGRLEEFENRLRELEPATDRAEQIDRRLLGSAVARVRWEMDVLRMWQRQPRFYVDQTIGTVFDLLTQPDVDLARLAKVVRMFEATGAILQLARTNLSGHAVAEFAQLAVAELRDVADEVRRVVEALIEVHPQGWSSEDDRRLSAAGAAAGESLVAFRSWLSEELMAMPPAQPIGPEVFQWFLAEVALMPFTPEELLAIGRLELERAVALETIERNRNRFGTHSWEGATSEGTTSSRPPSMAAQVAAEAEAEATVRRFYVERGLLSQPASLARYLNAPMPPYLDPIRWLGVTDDLTSPERLAQDGVSYVPTQTEDLPYFYAANAHDPLAGIVHEGVHYQQLALSWRHPRPLRRHYYDSGPNEGIAFYNEELMLATGLFEGNAHSREIMINFMRLRALRVEVDVRLAIGDLDIPAAAAYLEREVPMDAATAHEEAAFFAACPGQGLTYQIGKTQILRLLSDAVRVGGDGFLLQDFHDRLWLEGNVPLSLQRWELLGDDTELKRVEQLRTTTDRN